MLYMLLYDAIIYFHIILLHITINNYIMLLYDIVIIYCYNILQYEEDSCTKFRNGTWEASQRCTYYIISGHIV